MMHPTLFQEILRSLNQYASYNGNTVTGSQRIEIARACEALYSSVESKPSLPIKVDIEASLTASTKQIEPVTKPSPAVQEEHHTFDAVSTLNRMSNHVDHQTKLIAN